LISIRRLSEMFSNMCSRSCHIIDSLFGYSLRDALELIDALRFRSQAEKHELSALYEAKIKNMGNAGRNGGEYYTPRPLNGHAAAPPTKPKNDLSDLRLRCSEIRRPVA